MKTNKILYAALIAGATLGTVTSCSDSFLDEKLITEKGTAYFQTKEGIDDLVKGAYQKLKFKYNYIWGIYLYGMVSMSLPVVLTTSPLIMHTAPT